MSVLLEIIEAEKEAKKLIGLAKEHRGEKIKLLEEELVKEEIDNNKKLLHEENEMLKRTEAKISQLEKKYKETIEKIMSVEIMHALEKSDDIIKKLYLEIKG